MSNKNSRLRDRDPHAEREAAAYQSPLPSRELILEALEAAGVPVTDAQLAELLDISPHEQAGFAKRLAAMEREGQVMRNRRGAICMVAKLDLIKGRVAGHKDGFGFLVPEDGSPDLFLNPKEMHKVLHGDVVIGREIGTDRRGRREGAIVEVLAHGVTRVVGRLHEQRGVHFVVAEDRRISQDILIAADDLGGAQTSQVVVAELIVRPAKNVEPMGRVVEILGNYLDPGLEIEIALRKHDLPHVWPSETEVLAAQLPKVVRPTDRKGREDLRDLPLVTIDGETAKDFDDAVYCEPQGKGFRLVVAIADVSHYVKHNDALDREGRERGNSVYFPRRVIPMLPEELSNGLCSLNPKVDRLCMACDMAVNAKGKIERFRFYPALMHSRARLTYTQVAAMLYENDTATALEFADLLPHLANLDRVFRALLAAREARGAIDFDSSETQLLFDDGGKISDIVPVTRNDAHRLIEECMLAANVCAAEFLLEREHPTLFRVHQGPTPEKLAALREFLGLVGLQLGGGDAPSPKDYAQLRQRIDSRPDARLLQTVLLRSMQQAVYSPDNVGHFGLAYEAYTHFTSPIRRYPDLLVHRCIKAVLAGQQYKPGDWGERGMHASQTERRADEATRDVVNWLKCYYMKDRVGETAAGTISAVTSFGVFVALDDVFVEGLVHISDLGSDYFHFEPAAHELRGERTGQRFRLGDRLWVTVARVDLETSRIDFVLASRPALPLSEPELPTMPHVLPPGVVPKVKPAGKPRDIDKKALAAESDRAALIASARKVREARAGGTTRKGAPKTGAKQREQ